MARRSRTSSTPVLPPAGSPPGTLYLVATPIGNLEDVTHRAIRILGEVDLIAAEDTRRTAKLLNYYELHTKTSSLHQHNERRKIPHLLAKLEQGQSLALVTDAGTPLLSDPGASLVQAALARQFPVRAIPGPSAVLAALIVSGLVQSSFTFVGFPPFRSKNRKEWLLDLVSEPRPLVIFEAPHRIRAMLTDMLKIFGDRHVSICREMTKVHEELVKGPISEILLRLPKPRGEFTIVVEASLEDSEIVKHQVTKWELWNEFGQSTELSGLSRRAAVTQLAKKYGLSNRVVYAAIEEEKKKKR